MFKESQNPIIFKGIVWFTGCIVTAFLIWASNMEVSEVASAQGEIMPTSKVQQIQHPSGGVVTEILVADGTYVEKDMVLMKLDPLTSQTQLEQTRVQYDTLKIQMERLKEFIGYLDNLTHTEDKYYSTLRENNIKRFDINELAQKCNRAPAVVDGNFELVKGVAASFTSTKNLPVSADEKTVLKGIIQRCNIPQDEKNTDLNYVRSAGTINFRDKPSTDSTVLGTFKKGDIGIPVGEEGKWVQFVNAECEKGWGSKKYVNEEKTSYASLEKVTVDQPVPSTVLKKSDFSDGTAWYVAGKNSEWVHLVNENCQEGRTAVRNVELLETVLPFTIKESHINAPVFSTMQDVDQDLVKEQIHIYRQQVEAYLSTRQAYKHQMVQFDSEYIGLGKLKESLSEERALLEDELRIKKELYQKRVISKLDFLNIERKLSAKKGEIEQLAPKKNKMSAKINELIEKLREYDSHTKKANSLEMAETNNKLAQLSEVLKRNEQAFQQMEIKAPINGLVHGLRKHTLGGVISPGEVIMRIVPRDEKLVAEVQISSLDIGHIKPGQKAILKFTTYSYDRYGGVEGVLQDISPSTYVNSQGEPYYGGTIVLSKDYVGYEEGKNKIIPGMTLQADIKTGGKTLMQYLLKPIYRTASQAMHER